LGEEEALDRLTLQQYLDPYRQPLSDQSMEAILKLSEMSAQKERNKKKKLKKDRKTEKHVKRPEPEGTMILSKKLANDQKVLKDKKKKAKAHKEAPPMPLA
jgi:hypothetical protein